MARIRFSLPRGAALVGLCAIATPLPLVAEGLAWRDHFHVAEGAPRTAEGLRDWTGFYLGADAGFIGGLLGFTSAMGTQEDLGGNQSHLGIYGGYNWRMDGQWLWGIEGSYNASQLSHEAVAGFDDLLTLPARYEVALRLGMLTSPHTLAYSRLGVGAMEMEVQSTFAGSDTSAEQMFSIGVGLEAQLHNNLNARAELRHMQLFAPLVDAAGARYEPRDLALHLGLSYHFADQDQPAGAVVPWVSPDWTGFHAGAIIGVNSAIIDSLIEDETQGVTAAIVPDFGILLGYDHQFGGDWVAGAELSYAAMVQDFHDAGGNSLTDTQDTRFATRTAQSALALRLGYLVSPETLLFAKVGRASSTLELNEDFYALGGGGTRDIAGLQWGFGIETPIWRQLSLRLEGLQFVPDALSYTDNNQLRQVALDLKDVTAQFALSWRW